MFRKTSLKLALLYLLIIMTISLAFSVSIYQVSVRELNRGLQHQRDNLTIGLKRLALPPFDPSQIIFENQVDLSDSKETIVFNLVVVNLTILIGGGFLSYYLARRTLRPIEEAHAAQSRFTADASHELRTPIAAMQTEIEVSLMDPKLTVAQAKSQLQSNLEELGNLTALSEGLLRLARLENNHLDKSGLKIKTVVGSAIKRVRPQADKKSISVSLSKAKDYIVMGDRLSLEEAIVIILENAIKYSPPKSHVSINIKKDVLGAKIAIKDSGTGIAEADLPHIFERFYRSDTARSKNQSDGYGLGLSIAKKIIDLHCGKIIVTSKIGKGSTFTISLPLKRDIL